MSISVFELIDVLVAEGIRKELIICNDDTYSLPSPEWFNEAGKDLETFLFDLQKIGIFPAISRFDCDKYVRLAITQAMLSHAATSKLESGIAIGLIGVFANEGPHALVVAVHEKEGKKYVKYYEALPKPLCLKEYPRQSIQAFLCAFF
jgi:hypothetical protein